jgi:hypothetical protein
MDAREADLKSRFISDVWWVQLSCEERPNRSGAVVDRELMSPFSGFTEYIDIYIYLLSTFLIKHLFPKGSGHKHSGRALHPASPRISGAMADALMVGHDRENHGRTLGSISVLFSHALTMHRISSAKIVPANVSIPQLWRHLLLKCITKPTTQPHCDSPRRLAPSLILSYDVLLG